MQRPVAGQEWDAGRYAANARFVADLGAPVVELLAPQPGERILDLGCGDGVLSARLAELGCTVVGVDADPDLVRAARALGVDARRPPGGGGGPRLGGGAAGGGGGCALRSAGNFGPVSRTAPGCGEGPTPAGGPP